MAGASMFEAGSYVDVLDSSQCWRMAVIQSTDTSRGVYIHYDGWGEKWNEWISTKSHRLAPFRKYTRRYTGQESTVVRDFAYSVGVANAYRSLIRGARQELAAFASAYEITQFFTGKLFTYIDFVLSWMPMTDEELNSASALLEEFLGFSLHWLSALPSRYSFIYQSFSSPDLAQTNKDVAFACIWPELFLSVERILGCDPRLQAFISLLVPASEDHSATRQLGHCYIDLFLSRGEAVARVLGLLQWKDGEEPIPVELIPHLPVWQLFRQVRFDLALQQNYVALAHTALARLCHFSETDIRYYDKDTIQRITETTISLGHDTGCPSLIAESEEVELRVSAQLLKSKLLDKRVKGVNNFCEAVIRATVSKADSFEYFSEERLAEWIRNEGLIDIIITDRPHFEVLKRSLHLFSFLSEHGFLSHSDLSALWQSATDKHESYTRVVYDLLASLADFLPSSLLMLVYKQLKSVEVYTDFLIASMRKFTLHACSALRRGHRPERRFFLTDFLSILTSPPTLQPAVIDCISTAVVELLSDEVMNPFLVDSLRILLNEEAYRRAGTLPIAVALQVIRKGGDEEVTQVMRLFGAAQAQEVVERTLTWVTLRASKPLNFDDLRILLDFLCILSSKGIKVVSLRDTHMLQLWEAFTSPNSLSDNSEVFFVWLSQCVAHKAAFLQEETLNRIFVMFSALSPIAISRLQIECFRCFQQLFFRTNYLLQYLTFRDDFVLMRLSESLLGQNTLVTFAVYSRSAAIQRLAIRLISQLQLRLHYSVSDSVVTDFARQRIADLDNSDLAVVSGNLDILIGMIEDFETLTIAKAPPMAVKDIETVYYRVGADPSYKSLTLPKSERLCTLRKSIAAAISLLPERVILDHGCCSYTFVDDETLLVNLGHAFFFTVRAGLDEYRFRSVVEVVASEDAAIRRLFDVLERKEFTEKCWFILSRLTESEGIKSRIRALGADYSALMSTPSLHKQLFALRVLQQLAYDPDFAYTYVETRPHELITNIVSRFLSSGEDLVAAFQHYSPPLVAQYCEVYLRLMQKCCSLSPHRDEVSLTAITNCVLDLLFLFAKNANSDPEPQGYSLPNCVYSLILMLCKRREDYIEVKKAVAAYRNLKGLIFAVIRNKSQTFATFLRKFLVQLADSPFLVNEEIGGNVMSLLGTAVDETEASPEFFELCAQLITRSGSIATFEHFSALFTFLQHRVPEESYKAQDHGLTGALKVMKKLVKVDPELATHKVAEYVLSACLIDFNETQATQRVLPKCKSPESRLRGFKLLSALTQQSQAVCAFALDFLSPFFSNLSWRTSKPIHWQNSYSPLEKSATGFVGLKNLGCTCYMNSLLQQLFTLSSFRCGLLECDLQDSPDSVSYQLQKVAAGLWTSDKMFIQARGLCQAYRNWEGQPINPHEQMDVDEFFNGLMDKLEAGLKETARPKLVEEHFRGILTTQCIGQGRCTHCSERDEPFLTLPIEIKNKSSILQSLQALVTGEVLEGDNAYACDFCEQKVTASRRLCLRSLPNILLLTLRRFDFDMDTMTRVKLNTYCEFPLLLDMEPYTVEAVQPPKDSASDDRSKDYYQYQLRGVIIHVGSADAGHYYSFVRTEEKGWVEFNDISVEAFDPGNIPHEAFGTPPRMLGDVSKEEIFRMRNAYVLIYERSTSFSVKSKDDPRPQLLPAHLSPPSPSAHKLFSHYQNSNQKYWKIKRVFSPEFFTFIRKLLQRPSPAGVKFALCYYLTIHVRAKDRQTDLLARLFELLPLYQELCWWMLEAASCEPVLRELLVLCPVLEVKKCVVGLIEKCALCVSSALQEEFFLRLLSLLPSLPNRLARDDCCYFELLFRVGRLVPAAVISSRLPQRLMEALVNRSCQLPQVTPRLPRADDITLGHEDISEGRGMTECTHYCTNFHLALLSEVGADLSSEEHRLLQDEEVIAALVKGAVGRFGGVRCFRVFGRIMENRSPATDPVFRTIMHCLISILRVNEADSFRAPLLQLRKIVMISDQYQKERVAVVMQTVTQVMMENLMYIRVTEALVVFVHRLAQRVKPVRLWLQEYSPKLEPLSVWKQRYATWSTQSPNSLQLTKTYCAAQHSEFHPNSMICSKVMTLVNSKIMDRPSDTDSDDDLYDAALQPGTRLDLLLKEDSKHRIQVLSTFGPAHFVRYENFPQYAVMFISADDDKLQYPET